MKSHCIKFITLLTFVTNILAQDFNLQNLYPEIKSISKKLLKECLPTNCHLVALGRSPAPISAFIKTIDPNQVTNLPLSSFRHHPNIDIHGTISNQSDEVKLFKHFDNFLEPLLKNHKTIAIFDYAYGGKSIFATSLYIKRYLRSKNIPAQRLKVFPLIDSRMLKSVRKNANLYGIKYSSIDLNNYPHLQSALDHKELKSIAEYKGFNFLWDLPIQKNKDFKRSYFISELRQMMKNDPELKNVPLFCMNPFINSLLL